MLRWARISSEPSDHVSSNFPTDIDNFTVSAGNLALPQVLLEISQRFVNEIERIPTSIRSRADIDNTWQAFTQEPATVDLGIVTISFAEPLTNVFAEPPGPSFRKSVPAYSYGGDDANRDANEYDNDILLI